MWLGLALAASSLHGIVICVDGHGHVAIEPAHQEHGCCQDNEDEADASAKHSSVVYLAVIPSHGCSDCIDIPLSTDNVSILVRNAYQNGLARITPILVGDDMSAIMNERELQGLLSAPPYDCPPGRSHLLVMQKITVLRV